MERQLSAQETPYFRTSGVVCEDFLSRQIQESPGLTSGSARHKGTVGCFLAHKSALDSLRSRTTGDCFVMVFEDDIFIHPQFWSLLNDLDFPANAEMLFFNSAFQYRKKPVPKLRADNIYKIDQGYPVFIGAFSYLVKLSMLDDMIKKMDGVSVYQDVDQFYYSNFSCYTFCGPFMRVLGFKSDRDPDEFYNKLRPDCG